MPRAKNPPAAPAESATLALPNLPWQIETTSAAEAWLADAQLCSADAKRCEELFDRLSPGCETGKDAAALAGVVKAAAALREQAVKSFETAKERARSERFGARRSAPGGPPPGVTSKGLAAAAEKARKAAEPSAA